MNRLLADAVSALNALLALGIIAAGIVWGLAFVVPSGATDTTSVAIAALVGGVMGAFVAVVVCGLLAIAIDVRNTLRAILDRMDTGGLNTVGGTRAEPRLNR